jgi:hypothetical protein
MINQLNLGLLVLLSIGVTGCSAMMEDPHKVDMQELRQLSVVIQNGTRSGLI